MRSREHEVVCDERGAAPLPGEAGGGGALHRHRHRPRPRVWRRRAPAHDARHRALDARLVVRLSAGELCIQREERGRDRFLTAGATSTPYLHCAECKIIQTQKKPTFAGCSSVSQRTVTPGDRVTHKYATSSVLT